jgi:hypothetical protein
VPLHTGLLEKWLISMMKQNAGHPELSGRHAEGLSLASSKNEPEEFWYISNMLEKLATEKIHTDTPGSLTV